MFRCCVQSRCSFSCIPKYLTLFVVFICCPLILKLRFLLIVFLFGRKITISVFLVFKLILFDRSHWVKRERSWLTFLLIFFSDLLLYKKFVSSAKRCTALFFTASYKSLIKIKNNNGPKTDP